MWFIILVILTVLAIGAASAAAESNEGGWAFAFFLLALILGYFAYRDLVAPPPPKTAEELAAIEKRKIEIEELKTPKVFSQTDDGCTVYKFVDNGYNHYFTRCDKNVTTDSQYRSGKSTRTESIQTQVK